MNNYLQTNNNDEVSEMQLNANSKINSNYNSNRNNNMNHSIFIVDDDINNNENEENFENMEKTSDNSNNIGSEIESDLKKLAKNSYSQKNKYENTKKVNLIEDYLIKLKNCGYPEMGKIYLSPDVEEQEKTYN